MVGENDMLDVGRRIARHMARHAIVTIGQACGLRSAAIGSLMAAEAFTTKIRGFVIGGWNGMGIVASTAPELLRVGSLARALRPIFGVAGHSHGGGRTGAHENRQIIRQAIAGAKCEVVLTRFRYSDFSGKMALFANAVALRGGQPG